MGKNMEKIVANRTDLSNTETEMFQIEAEEKQKSTEIIVAGRSDSSHFRSI